MQVNMPAGQWMPRFADWGAFNNYLEDQCRNRQGGIVFDSIHYLRLIERKIMSFDQAARLQN